MQECFSKSLGRVNHREESDPMRFGQSQWMERSADARRRPPLRAFRDAPRVTLQVI